jgi:hypothetical protein
MPSILTALLASLPLLLLPPGVCPCHVFGLECHNSLAPDRDGDGDSDGDQDCGCPKVKTLASPGMTISPQCDSTPSLAAVPETSISPGDGARPSPEALSSRIDFAAPPLYLTLRALRC